MAKVINHKELAELVHGLIVCPDTLGQLDGIESYTGFLEAIADVVCDFVGGEVSGVDMPELSADRADEMDGLSPADRESMTSWLICIRENDSLPDDGGVWSLYDTDANEDWHMGQPPAAADIRKTRASVQSVFLQSAGVAIPDPGMTIAALRVSRELVDEDANTGLSLQADFAAEDALIDFLSGNDPVCSVRCGTRNGTPHITLLESEGSALLHIHAAHGGFVLATDQRDDRFEQAPQDEYSYNQQNSLLIR